MLKEKKIREVIYFIDNIFFLNFNVFNEIVFGF